MDKEDNSLFKYERGLIYDVVRYITGLNTLNLVNSGYLIKKNIFKYGGDVVYNFFSVSQRQKIKDIKLKNSGLLQEAEKIASDLGIKSLGTNGLDTYYGTLIDYAWHSRPIEAGAYYTPIYHLIDKLKDIFPEEKSKLSAIYRRMVYLELLENEFIYLKKKYDFDTIPILIEWATNKFETFTTLLVELSVIIIEFYNSKHPILNKQIRFEDLVNCLKKIDPLFGYINFTIEGLLAVVLRNDIVHSSGYELKKEGSYIYINVNEEPIEKKLNFGILKDYLKDVDSLYTIRKVPNTVQEIIDTRFPYIKLYFKISKNGTIDYPKTKISFKLELEEYLELMMGFLFLLSRELFDSLIKIQNNTIKIAVRNKINS